MAFRTRLTDFFVLIVVVPMVAVGFLVFGLIGDSEQGKANARANGIASEAASVYEYASHSAQLDAQTIARDPVVDAAIARGARAALRARLSTLASHAGLSRVVLSFGTGPATDVGDRAGLAPAPPTSWPRGDTRP